VGIKFGVERSETPGWPTQEKRRAREAAEGSCDYENINRDDSAVGRSADFNNSLPILILCDRNAITARETL
jgi:hypothetical protein